MAVFEDSVTISDSAPLWVEALCYGRGAGGGGTQPSPATPPRSSLRGRSYKEGSNWCHPSCLRHLVLITNNTETSRVGSTHGDMGCLSALSPAQHSRSTECGRRVLYYSPLLHLIFPAEQELEQETGSTAPWYSSSVAPSGKDPICSLAAESIHNGLSISGSWGRRELPPNCQAAWHRCSAAKNHGGCSPHTCHVI